ncbi:hypothetical protein ACTOB_003699 [Actinoplanes oblitus]|uniref:Uncharacterized protein n=1 Tax=Actinoplanes oblitus TaxID=3040509 RepID=A0ABY8WSE8_9ACTN|nr:hypothetical protein [Actinoplanes oblitus]WIN00024.1 hypothetical protein ACTOB_003699 [Actinoplanes oblitus]
MALRITSARYSRHAVEGIVAAVIERARDWHLTITAETLVRQRLPRWYHDPSISTPQLGPPDGRPYRSSIALTRSAAATINAAENHIEALRDAYGPGSEHYLRAANTWRTALARLLAGWRTAHTDVQACGPLSLQITDAAGSRAGRVPRRPVALHYSRLRRVGHLPAADIHRGPVDAHREQRGCAPARARLSVRRPAARRLAHRERHH